MRRRNRGTVLVVVLVVVFALASLVLTLVRTVHTDAYVSQNVASQIEADIVARAAEQYVLAVLDTQMETLYDLDESNFANVPVGDGAFWIVRPGYDDDDLPEFGLVNEAAKLDVNSEVTILASRLGLIAGLEPELADALIDWMDEDDDTTGTGGAESSYYLGLEEPYTAKNAVVETLDELSMIRGFTHAVLYGDPSRSQASSTIQFSSDRYLREGIYDLLTIYSQRPTTAADGSQRVGLGNQQRPQLLQMLTQRLGQQRGVEIFGQIGNQPLTTPLMLAFRTGMTRGEFEQIEDYVALFNDGRGVLNLNEAPREAFVAWAGFGLTTADIDAILAYRAANRPSNPRSIGWVIEALPNFSASSAGLAAFAGAGRHWSADIVAVAPRGRAFRRVRIIVDTGTTPMQIIYRRDITDRGLPLDASVLEEMRSGNQGVTR
jgi:type II secretory pathway component PulK